MEKYGKVLPVALVESIVHAQWGSECFRENSMRNDEVLKIKDVAVLLKVGEKTIYTMAQSGELPAFKVRGQWRFSRKDIDDWIEAQKQTSQELDKEKGK